MFKKIWYYIKDFIGRSAYFYKKNGEYRELTNIVGFLFIVFNAICLYVCYFCKLEDGFFIFCRIFFIMFFVLGWVGESFKRFPSDYVKPDIDKLPNKIEEHSISIQYTPPKGLNPSEVGLLYNLKSYFTNFDCLLYKWEYEGLIKIEDRGNGSIMIHKNKEISNKTPSYERQFWSTIFKAGFKDKVVWKWNQSNLDGVVISKLHLKLLDYCVEQGILYKNTDYLFFVSIIGAFGGGFIFGYILGVIIILLSFVYVFYYVGKQGNYLGMKIGRTKRGDELYAHIIGYKYWLEKCEEKQVKELLKGDPGFKSRTLPYLVALRTDWRFLVGKFS